MIRAPSKLSSAGLLVCRGHGGAREFLLAHPGGPFFAKKDLGVWTVPKGSIDPGESPLEAAKRELSEELGYLAPPSGYVSLGEVVQKSGKRVLAWAVLGTCDPSAIRSNTFELEWPPRSGRRRAFPEVDRAAFFGFAEASRRILPAQVPLLERAAAIEFGTSEPAPLSLLGGDDLDDLSRRRQ